MASLKPKHVTTMFF